MSLIKFKGKLLKCESVLVKDVDCAAGFYSFPLDGIWEWEVESELNGAWSGLESSSPVFSWNVYGTNCEGRPSGRFVGKISTMAIFRCKSSMLCEVKGDVEVFDAGYDEGRIYIDGSEVALITSFDNDVRCATVNTTNSVVKEDLLCCVKIECVTNSNDPRHHLPGSHNYKFVVNGAVPPIDSYEYNLNIQQIEPEELFS